MKKNLVIFTENLYEYNSKKLYQLLLFASFLALSCAYIAEYIFGFMPCILCLYERIPYFILLFVSILALIVKNKKIISLIIFLVIMLLLTEILITIYHVGVEHLIFEETIQCKSDNLNKATTIEGLKAEILSVKLAHCSEPSLKFLGFSMAEWNLLYVSIILLIIMLRLCNKIRT